MGWEERVKEAAYTSPSGVRFAPLLYEDVSKVVSKKTSAHEFPDADGTLVQDQGPKGGRYPLRVFFTGDDHDLEAKAFDGALLERGAGRLEHPIYGTIDVVPFGDISRLDKLKTAANQTIFELNFYATISTAFPSSQVDPGAQLAEAVTAYNEKSAEQFAEQAQLDTTVEKSGFRNGYETVIGTMRSTLQQVADKTEKVGKEFDAIGDSITSGLDNLLEDPQTLIAQTNAFVEKAGQAEGGAQAKLDSYRSVIDGLINSGRALGFTNFLGVQNAARGASVGQIVSVLNSGFETRTDAIEAAEAVLDGAEALVSWSDENYQFFGEVDTGEAYQKYQEAVALTVGFLVELAFDLKQERTITLTRARTPIDLAAELYRAVDSQLDFLITSNDLTGDEIFEIPKGRTIVYYV